MILLYIYICISSSFVHAETFYDAIEVGNWEGNGKADIYQVIRPGLPWNSPVPTEENPDDAPDAEQSLFIIKDHSDEHFFFTPPMKDFAVFDIDGNGQDDGIVLRREFEGQDPIITFSNHTFDTVINNADILLHGDFNNDDLHDFLVAKVNGSTIDYQIFLNDNISQTQGLSQFIGSDQQSFTWFATIQEVLVIKDENQYLLVLISENVIQILDYQHERTEGFAPVFLLHTESPIKDIQKIESVLSGLSVDFNLFIQTEEDFSLRKQTGGFESVSKRMIIQGLDTYQQNGYELKKVYMPQNFEGRIALYFEGPDNNNPVVFYILSEENESEVVFKEDTGSLYQSLAHPSVDTWDIFSSSPQSLVYRSSYPGESLDSNGGWTAVYESEDHGGDEVLSNINYLHKP